MRGLWYHKLEPYWGCESPVESVTGVSNSWRCHHSLDQIMDFSLECQLSGRLARVKSLGSDQGCRSPWPDVSATGASARISPVLVPGVGRMLSHQPLGRVCSEEQVL